MTTFSCGGGFACGEEAVALHVERKTINLEWMLIEMK
jgi:hypothetical protein